MERDLDFQVPILHNRSHVLKFLQDRPTLIDDFHKASYNSLSWTYTTWFGVKIHKHPCDMWSYQEIIYNVKSDLIIETGTLHGGSAFYMASMLDFIGSGKTVTIDGNEMEDRPIHDRITYMKGSSTDLDVFNTVKRTAESAEIVMATLDSCHLTSHVYEEMKLYSELVTPESFMIVEDSNVDGKPVLPGYREDHSEEGGGADESHR
jgi:cephalosporin hydroxylase